MSTEHGAQQYDLESTAILHENLVRLQNELRTGEEQGSADTASSGGNNRRAKDTHIIEWLKHMDNAVPDIDITIHDIPLSIGQVLETANKPVEPNIGQRRLTNDDSLEAPLLLPLQPLDQTQSSMTLHYRATSIMSLFSQLAENPNVLLNNAPFRIFLTDVEDQTARFMIWAKNIGAVHEAVRHESLDYRLRNASQLRERVFKVLGHLEESLQKVALIFSGVYPDETWHIVNWAKSKQSDSENSSTGSTSDISSDDVRSDSLRSDGLKTSESQELLGAAKDAITNLFKLSSIIRYTPPSFGKEALRYLYDPTFDYSHVQMKFPAAPDFLVRRLGKVITMRRQFFHYRREHRRSLAHGFNTNEATRKKQAIILKTASDTGLGKFVPKSIRSTVSDLGKSQLNTEATAYKPPDGSGSADEKPRAGSVGSQTSFATTAILKDGSKPFTIPALADIYVDGLRCTYGEYFECPYCYTIQIVENRRAWKKHVFRDLQPYVCTFEQCAMKVFPSRHAWFDHEVQSHRKNYVCSCRGCESYPFDSAVALGKHLMDSHDDTFTAAQIPAIIDQCQEPPTEIPLPSCQLCGDGNIRRRDVRIERREVEPSITRKLIASDSKEFRRHLGRHMEQLALFALPKHVTFEDGHANSDEAAADIESDSISVTTRTSDSRNSLAREEAGLASVQERVIQPIYLQAALEETRPSYGKEGKCAEYVLAGYIQVIDSLNYYGNIPKSLSTHEDWIAWGQELKDFAHKISNEKDQYEDWLRMVLAPRLSQSDVSHALDHPSDQAWNNEEVQEAVSDAVNQVHTLDRYWSTMSRLGVSLVTFWNLLELDREGMRRWNQYELSTPAWERMKRRFGENDGILQEKLKNIASCNKELMRLLTVNTAKSPVEVKFKASDINSRLEIEAMNGREDVVRQLLSQGADVNAQTENSGSALQAVAWGGSESIVQLLLENGADVNAQGGDYGNPLQAAAWRGHDVILLVLLQHGADINAGGGYYGNALQAAARGGHIDTVRILLEQGAFVDAQGGQFGHALQAAARGGHIETVHVLLANGANVNAHGGEYHTALQVASMIGHKAIVRLLLEAGADVDAIGGRYGTALQAASRGGYKTIIRLLLEKGAGVNSVGGEYYTALQAALVKGDEEVIQLLRQHGAKDL